jgi:F5/8 type C domain
VGGAGYRVEVHGSVGGNLVVGDHNLIVNAAVGSSVQVLQEAQRPKPVRRPSVRVLPRRPAAVLGRNSEIGTITAAVVGQSTLQVYGVPGIGKSTLLRQAAFDVADEADGIVFLNATGRSHLDVPQEIFEACYETSGYRPSPTELRRLMTGVRGCVIIDDLVCSPDELTGVLDAAPDAAVVFAASERELWGSGQVLALAGLSEDAALALVRREFGRDLAPDETAAVIAAWHSDGGSPMRLLRAAAAMSQKRPAAMEQAAADGPSVHSDDTARFDREPPPAEAAARFDGAADPTVPLVSVASESAASAAAALVAALPAAERDVYQLLGFVAPAAASVEVIGALAHTSNLVHVTTAADRLVQIGLVDRADDAYRIAEDLIEPVEARTYRRNIVVLVSAMLEWLSRPEATPSDTADHGRLIVSLLDAAVRTEHADLATRLARVAAPLAAMSLRWSVWRDVLTSGQAAAKACDDQEAYAYFTHERGIRLLCLGQAAAAAAVLATAAGLWHGLGLTQGVAAAMHAQAIATGAGAAAASASVGPAAHPVPPAPHPAPPHLGPPHLVPTQPSSAHAGAAARPGRRVVGRARVAGPGSGFPTVLVTVIAVIVVALAVAAILIVPHLHRAQAANPPITTTQLPSPTVDATAPAPVPVAFSDNTAAGADPNAVLDGDPGTFWSSRLQRSTRTDDSWIGIDMGIVGSRSGLSVTPRQRFVGFPSAFRIEFSLDSVTWTTVPGQDYGPNHPDQATADGPQIFLFAEPVQARYIRFFATNLSRPAVAAELAQSAFALQLADISVLG